ncbi:MAG: hypothetical protein ABIS27_13665 [Longimicrobiales bacterium]
MKRFMFALLGVFAVAACDREDPTTIGAPLVENGAVRTFEVTLEASQFLVRDTSFSAFAPSPTIPFLILALNYEGALNAHALAKFAVDPFLGVTDAAGILKFDSTPKLQRGHIVLKFDTVATKITGPVLLRMYEAAEDWDTVGVTWRVRNEAGALWRVPGGTPGALLDTATYLGGDSVAFRVDTLVLARWRSKTEPNLGVLFTVASGNGRLRSARPTLRVAFRTTLSDTIVTQSTNPFVSRFISDPVVPITSGNTLVGGSPSSFRAVLEVRPDLASVVVPCPFSASCTVKLKNASIARADLLFEPIPSPAGFAPELPVTVLAYTLLPTPQLPLVRSPLGQGAGFITVSNADFRSTSPTVARLTVTQFVRELVQPVDSTTFKSRYLTLLQGGTATFGYATFRSQPRLRLRLSVAQEIQLP